MPQDHDDPLDDGEVTPVSQSAKPAAAEPKPSRFHPRYLKEAERLGLAEGDIEACANNAELAELIRFERDSVRAEQARQPGRGGDRAQQSQPTPASPPPPPPPAEPDWSFGEAFDHVDPAIANEIKRLGKQLLKATKNGDKDRYDELKEEIAGLKAENEALRAKDSPIVKKINKVLAEYTHLFGTEDDRADDPEGLNAKRFRWLDDEMSRRKEAGRLTQSVEKDLRDAIAHLFPGSEGGKEAAQAPAKKPAKPRVEEWAEAGSHPATHRNGAQQTNKPGGKKAAAQKVKEWKREQGVDDDLGEDDFDDDDEI
jgi:hypothetical protein